MSLACGDFGGGWKTVPAHATFETNSGVKEIKFRASAYIEIASLTTVAWEEFHKKEKREKGQRLLSVSVTI